MILSIVSSNWVKTELLVMSETVPVFIKVKFSIPSNLKKPALELCKEIGNKCLLSQFLSHLKIKEVMVEVGFKQMVCIARFSISIKNQSQQK